MSDLPTTESTPAKGDKRMIAVGLAFGAAACLLFAVFTQQWLVNSSRVRDIGFGLRSNYHCIEGFEGHECIRMSNAEFVTKWQEQGPSAAEQVSGAFAPMGWATLVLCVLAALGLIASAAIALAKKRPQLPVTPPSVALLGIMGTLITGMVFVAKKPGPAGYVGVGTSFWIFGIGTVLGIIAAQWLAKINRPADPDLLADSMNPDQF